MAISAFQLPSLFEVRFVDKPSGCERPHTHSSLIVSAVLDGYICLQINDKEIRIEKEMVAAVGPNILHSVRFYSDNFNGVYVLDILKPPPFCKEFRPIHFQTFKSQQRYGKQIYTDYIELCQKLLSSLKDSQKIELYIRWVNDFFDTRNLSCTEAPSRDLGMAAQIREILNKHEEEIPPFNEISQICGLSKERCNRIFRRAYNISIQAYFLNEKAARARTLLASNKTLSEIALECGFYDQSHFTRIFKEIFQISPAKYRSLIGETGQSHTRNDG